MARAASPGFTVIAKLNDQFTRPMKTINREVAQTTGKLKAITAMPGQFARNIGLDKVGMSIANLGTQFGKLRSAITGVIYPFMRIGILAGGIGLATFTTELVQTGAELVRLNQITGISIETLSGLQYAAKQSSVSSEELNMGFRVLNKTLSTARKGGKQATETLKILAAAGIAPAEAATISAEQAFFRLARRLQFITDEGQQRDLVKAVLGPKAEVLLPLLNEGEEGIRKLMEEAQRLGIVMGDETARKAKFFDDTMTRLTGHIKGVSLSVFEQLIGEMQGGADAMDNFIEAHKPKLVKELTEAIEFFIDTAKGAYNLVRHQIVPALETLWPAFQMVETVIGKNNARLLLFTSVVAPGAIGAVLGITKGLIGLTFALAKVAGLGKAFTLLSTAFGAGTATTLGTTIAAFAAAGAALLALGAIVGVVAYGIWKHWDDIKQSFSDAVDFTRQTVGRFRTVMAEVPDAAATEWAKLTSKDFWLREWTNTKSIFNEMFSALGVNVSEGVRAWGDNIRNAGQWIRDAMVAVFTEPFETIRNAWSGFVDGLLGMLSRLWGGAKNIAAGKGFSGEDPGKTNLPTFAGDVGGAAAGLLQQQQATPGGAWAPQQANKDFVPGGAWAPAASQTQKSELKATIDIRGLPPGSTVSETHSGPGDVRLNPSYAGRALAGT